MNSPLTLTLSPEYGGEGIARPALLSQLHLHARGNLSDSFDFRGQNGLAWYNLGHMRTIRWVPLTFLAGAHGFAIFAPYLAIVLAVYHIVRSRRKARQGR